MEWDEKDWWRDNIDFESQSAVRALVKTKNDKWSSITEEEAKNYFDWSYQANTYNLTAKSFAEIVDEYCKSQWKNHKIMFMIDEVWQFVSGDVQLMLDLQTVTEEFRKLWWEAWIAVTSQQAIEQVTEIEWQASDDFSRIQARFKTKLSLSSTNVDEVIKRRLLEKNTEATKELSEIFPDKQHTMSNMFSFEGVTNIDHFYYKENKEFVDLYPLVPYQIDLTKEVLKRVSSTWHAWWHMAVWERSALDIFQQAIICRENDDVWTLVPFDVVYDAIESNINSSIRTIISNAEKHWDVDKPLGIRVLKVLFLLKYVRWIPLTVDNITILLIDNIETWTLELKAKVFKALESLKWAWFINQRADDYEFLSDEEQEIEREIKSITVDNNEVYDVIYKHFFEDQPFGKLSVDKHDYDFVKLIDGYSPWRWTSDGQKLSIQICTPWFSENSNNLVWKDFETRIVLSKPEAKGENDPMKCIIQYLKIQKYVKRNDKDSSAAERIRLKALEMQSFKDKAKDLLNKAAINWKFYRGSTELHISKPTFKEVALELLNDAFENSYTEFKTLPPSKNQDLADIIRLRQQKWLMDGNIPLAKAHENILNTIRIEEWRWKDITLAWLQLQYKDMPYGWKDSDVNKLVFELWAAKKIVIKYSWKEVMFDDDNIIDYLTKANYKDKIEIEKKQEIWEELTRSVCETLMKIDKNNSDFNTAIDSKEPDEIRRVIIAWKDKTHDSISELMTNYNYHEYPWKLVLEKMKDILDDIKQFWNTNELFNHISNESQNLIDTYNEVSVVKSFFEDQKWIWDLWFNELEKLKKLNSELLKDIKTQYDRLKEIIESDSPYDNISEIRKLNKDLEDFYNGLLTTKKKELLDKIEASEKNITEKYKDKIWDDWWTIEREFINQKKLINEIDKYESLWSLSNDSSDWIAWIIKKCVTLVSAHTVTTTTQTTTTEWWETSGTTTVQATIKVKSVKVIDLLPSDKRTISSEEDIDVVLSAIKEKLKDDMKDGWMIILS